MQMVPELVFKTMLILDLEPFSNTPVLFPPSYPPFVALPRVPRDAST